MVDFIEWNEGWRLGIDEIDRQHQEMAACLNRLVEECTRQKNRAGLQEDDGEARALLVGLANQLYEKTRDHFHREEKMMRDARYPAYPAHAREHVMLLGELKATFVEKEREGCSVLGEDILQSLKSWLIVHINRSDREFSKYMHGRQAHTKETA